MAMIFKGILDGWRGLTPTFLPAQAMLLCPARPTTVVVFDADMDCLLEQRAGLLRELVAQGFRVVACAPERHIRAVTALARMGVEYQPIPATATGLHPLDDLGTSAALFAILRREHATATVCFGNKLALFVSLAARMARIPHIFAMIENVGAGAKRGLFAPLWRFGHRLALACNRHVFFANAGDQATYRSNGMLSPSTETSAINATPPRGGLLQEVLKDMQFRPSTWA